MLSVKLMHTFFESVKTIELALMHCPQDCVLTLPQDMGVKDRQRTQKQTPKYVCL